MDRRTKAVRSAMEGATRRALKDARRAALHVSVFSCEDFGRRKWVGARAFYVRKDAQGSLATAGGTTGAEGGNRSNGRAHNVRMQQAELLCSPGGSFLSDGPRGSPFWNPSSFHSIFLAMIPPQDFAMNNPFIVFCLLVGTKFLYNRQHWRC